jgi:hypothetical protein
MSNLSTLLPVINHQMPLWEIFQHLEPSESVYHNPITLGLDICKTRVLSGIEKSLGMQDIQFGEEELGGCLSFNGSSLKTRSARQLPRIYTSPLSAIP